MIARLLVLLVSMLAVCATTELVHAQGNRYALVIGVRNYPQITQPRLEFADVDAKAFADFIRSPRGGGFSVTLLTNEQATRTAILDSINALRNTVRPGDILYVYFSGHGLIDDDGSAYFMSYDGNQTRPRDRGFRADLFLEYFTDGIEASRMVFFIDACHAAAAPTRNGIAKGAGDLMTSLAAVWNRELNAANNEPLAMGFFSSSPRQLSFEDPNLGHGIFTYYLLRGLAGEADGRSTSAQPDGIIRAGELQNFLQERVGRHSRAQFRNPQDPKVSPSFDDDFALATTSSPEPVTRPALRLPERTAAIIELRGHRDYARAAEFSPDGERVVTYSLDGTARVWRADGTGTPIVLRGHRIPKSSAVNWAVNFARFSPDGQRIITAGGDSTARIWRVDGAGTPIVLRNPAGAVKNARFSPDGQYVVTLSDSAAIVWRADAVGEPVVLRGHGYMTDVAFSPDGQRVVTIADSTARVWRADGRGSPTILKPPGGVGHPVTGLFSPDGQAILIGQVLSSAWVWRADGTGNPIELPLAGASFAFSPDGRNIVSYMWNRVRVWRTDWTTAPVTVSGPDRLFVEAAAITPDAQHIVAAFSDGTVRVWRADGVGEPNVLYGENAWQSSIVSSAVFSPDLRHVLMSGYDGIPRVKRIDYD